jgi:hypothetical protein
VKEKLLKKQKVPAALLEVTVADTGEWHAGGWNLHLHCPLSV